MSEASIERYLKQQVRALGGRCVKLVPWAETGLPDRMILLPGKRCEFVELKAPTGGRLRTSQRRVRRWLQELGWGVPVLNTKETIDQWVQENE